MSTKSSNPVLGQETVASLRKLSKEAQKRYANAAAKLRTGRFTPKELKALAAEAKAADKALKKAENKARQANNRETNDAISRLNNAKKGSYGSMDGKTYDRKSGTKQLTAAQLKAKAAQKTEDQLAALLAREGVTAVPPQSSAKSTTTGNSENFTALKKLKEQAGDDYDPMTMTRRKEDTTDDYDPNSMKKQPSTKKKRDRLFGLDFLPEIDSKKGGDKVNLPFGLGSYETLPQEEETSMNKKGGRIKYKSGGKIRKAGCKRGMGKAMRGY